MLTKPNQTKPNQTKPNQTKPNQTKPNQTKVRRGILRVDPARRYEGFESFRVMIQNRFSIEGRSKRLDTTLPYEARDGGTVTIHRA